MKWYSIKKYKIPVNFGSVFVALSFSDICTYSIAEYRHNMETDEYNWFDENNLILVQVTHFCIPDPIEVDE